MSSRHACRFEAIEEEGSTLNSDDAESVRTAEKELRSIKSAKKETEGKALEIMEEMKELMKKCETGTATRKDRERKEKKIKELSEMKKKLEKVTDEASTRERKLLETKTKVKEREVFLAMKKKAIRSVVRDVCEAESVDLVFIIDGTGSMSPHISNVKNSISGIVKNVLNSHEDLDLRLACVCYRDLCDGNKRFEVLDFVSSVDKFSLFVGGLSANGGGDAPEDMAGGIQKANQLSWKFATRVTFLIADAPCHGTQFHSFSDDHPSGTPGIDVVRELKKLTKNHNSTGSMSVYFARIQSATDTMLAKFESEGIEMEVVDLDEHDKLTGIVTKSIRHSVFKTISVTGSTRSISLSGSSKGGSKLKSYHISERKPSSSDWDPDDSALVHVFRNKPINSMAELQAPLLVGKALKGRATRSVDKQTMHLCRAKNPFAQGQIRIAFYGQLASNKKDLHKTKQTLILKSFKRTGAGANDRKEYLNQMEISNVVFFLALAYNKSMYRPAHCAKIRCLECCVVEEVLDVNEAKGMRRFCAEEPLPIPPGKEFVKFSNNTGYWNPTEIDESLLRFTAYTHQITDGYLMATDLQGIKDGNQFYLTDPVLLCKDESRFGNTNLGQAMMKKCIRATHALMKENGWSI